MTQQIVIVGAGQAGGWAAATLRQEGYTGRIVLIGAEPHVPYERPPLSKAILQGVGRPEHTHLMPADKFAELELDFRPGVRVTAIDRHHQQVELTGGERISYDQLILTTGGTARPAGSVPDTSSTPASSARSSSVQASGRKLDR